MRYPTRPSDFSPAMRLASRSLATVSPLLLIAILMSTATQNVCAEAGNAGREHGLRAKLSAWMAARKAHKEGRELMDSRAYDEAVLQFRTAARLKPKSKKYAASLRDATETATKSHLQSAGEAVASKDLVSAERHLVKLREYEPASQTYKAMLEDVRENIDRAVALQKQAQQLESQEKWKDAFAAITDALAIHRTLDGASSEREAYSESGYQHYVNLARNHLTDGAWDDATDCAKSALIFRPSAQPPGAVLARANDGKEAERLVLSATQQANDGQFEKALTRFAKARVLYPELAGLDRKEREVRESFCQHVVHLAREELDAGDLAGTIRLYLQTEAILPSWPNARAPLAEARGMLASEIASSGRRFNRDNLQGAALVSSLMANAIVPGTVDDDSLNALTKSLRERVSFRVRLSALQSESRESGLDLAELATCVLRCLSHSLPANARLLQKRDDTGPLREQDRHESSDTEPRSQLDEKDLTVRVAISSLDLTTSKTPSRGTSRYQTGTRQVENPGYGMASLAYQTVKRNVGRMEADLAAGERTYSTEANRGFLPGESAQMRSQNLAFLRNAIQQKRQRLASARQALAAEASRLASVPRTVSEAVYASHTYIAQEHTKKCVLEGRIQLLSGKTQDLVASIPLSVTVKESDTQVDGEPSYNVSPDPLELPTDAEMYERLSSAAQKQILELLPPRLATINRRLLAAAELAVKQGGTSTAVERYVDYLVACPGSSDATSEAISKIAKSFKHPSDLIALEKELSAYQRNLPAK